MNKLICLFFLSFLLLSCAKDEKDLNKVSSNSESRTHTWTESEIATIDSFAYVFLQHDTTELLNMMSLLQTNSNNNSYSNIYEVLSDVGLSQTIYNKLILLPLEDGFADIENEEVTEDFEAAYKNYIDRGFSLVFFTNGSNLVELRKDPCSFTRTATDVLRSALEIMVGCTSGIGCAFAAWSVGERFYNYVKDCS